jgi:hypothetical protein
MFAGQTAFYVAKVWNKQRIICTALKHLRCKTHASTESLSQLEDTAQQPSNTPVVSPEGVKSFD